MDAEHVSITLPRARVTLRGWRTGTREGTPTLCLHGWLDNSSSFEGLAEQLPDVDLVAIDLPGHGHSDPLPSAVPQVIDYVACVLELAHVLSWNQFQLIGHSLGGMIAALVAGTHPEKTSRLALIEAVVPLSSDPAEPRASLARYVHTYLADTTTPRFASRSQAVRTRARVQDSLIDTAELLSSRDLIEAPGGGYTWTGDEKLRYPFAFVLTETQVLAFLRNITAPTLLVTAERGGTADLFDESWMSTMKDVRLIRLLGGHHLHMENIEAVSTEMRAFLELPRVPCSVNSSRWL